ncbi:MAG: T9SS type A sorting domain-containing protein [Prolixibacteraceae bacterium]|nr:T9SS type A sorting domain-containing protein [Prolixibacteraceae bacterium]
MMLRLVLIVFLILKFLNVFSQDYLPVNPGRVAVFDNISAQHFIKVDSVLNKENVCFYFNRVVDYSNYRCVVLNKPSWLGEKLLVHPDGYCSFFNKNNDTINIRVNALLNENWLAYSDSLVLIRAHVLLHDVKEFLGLSDSVKTISFQAYAYNGDSVDHYLNNKQLELSKNYGMVQAFNFLNFLDNENESEQYHLVGLSEPKVGVQNLTWFDVFDFQVGDEIHVFEIYADWEVIEGSSSTKKIIFKYIERDDFADSIIYTVSRTIEHQYRTMIYDSIWTTFDTIVSVIRQNENFDQLPEYPVFYDNEEAFGVNSQASANGLTRKHEYYYAFVREDSGCWRMLHYDGFYGYFFYKALGGPYYKADTGPAVSHERSLVYYKKGSSEWGSAYVITDVESTHISNEIKVYPNPASSFIYVDVPKLSESLNFELFDWTGRLVLQKTVLSCFDFIDISYLKKGLYFYIIENDNSIYKSEKVIISNH